MKHKSLITLAASAIVIAGVFAPTAALANEGEVAPPVETVQVSPEQTVDPIVSDAPSAEPEKEIVEEKPADAPVIPVVEQAPSPDEGVINDVVTSPSEGEVPAEGGAPDEGDNTDVSNPGTPVVDEGQDSEEEVVDETPAAEEPVTEFSLSSVSPADGAEIVGPVTVSFSYATNVDPSEWIRDGSTTLEVRIVDAVSGDLVQFVQIPITAANANGTYSQEFNLPVDAYTLRIRGAQVLDCGDCDPYVVQHESSFTVVDEPVEPEERVRTETRLSNTIVDCDADPEENATDYFEQRNVKERKDSETGEWVFVEAGEWKFAYEETRAANEDELAEADCEVVPPVEPVDPVDPIDPVDPVTPVDPQPQPQPAVILTPAAPKEIKYETKAPAQALAATGADGDNTGLILGAGGLILAIGATLRVLNRRLARNK